jgi:hypothetical protein
VAAILFAWLERRGRNRWWRVPVTVGDAERGPYRSSRFVEAHRLHAPLLVQSSAFTSLVLAHLCVPLVLLALVRFPFDGIAVPLVPSAALAAFNGWCAWLLLSRSPQAESAARTGAVASLMANIGCLAMAAVHLGAVELSHQGELAHKCASSITSVVLVFASASILQALLTLTALRFHRSALGRMHDGSIADLLRARTPSTRP